MSLFALQILATGIVLSIACSLLGVFLVLRKQSMMVDALSHSVLPGIVLAFLFTGSRSTLPMIVGAILAALLASFLIEFLQQKVKLLPDASIGTVFSFFFASGILLLTVFAGQVDLDQDCVLYGELAFVPLDLLNVPIIGFFPKGLITLGICLLGILSFIYTFYFPLVFSTFNSDFVTLRGFHTERYQFGLTLLTTLTTVLAFEIAGSILIINLFVAPALTALHISQRIPSILIIACLVGSVSVMGGYGIAYILNASISGSIAVVSTIIFICVYTYHKIRQ